MISETLMNLVIPTLSLYTNHSYGHESKIIDHKMSYVSQAKNIMKIKVNYLAVGDWKESLVLESML